MDKLTFGEVSGVQGHGPLPCIYRYSASLSAFSGCLIPLIVDFFDGKHNIVLGGSWATHPRIAGRTTL